MVLIWHKRALYLVTDEGPSQWGLQAHACDALIAAGVRVGGRPDDDQSNLFAAFADPPVARAQAAAAREEAGHVWSDEDLAAHGLDVVLVEALDAGD